MGFFKPNVEKMKAKGDVEGLIKALGHKGEDVRTDAAKALGDIEDVKAVEALIQALKDTADSVRYEAATALERLGWKPGDDTEKAHYLIAKREWDDLVGLGGPAVESLIQALKNEDPDVRTEAADALRKIGEPAVEPLIKALKDENRDVREVAAECLGEIGDARAVEPLIQSLHPKDAAPFEFGFGVKEDGTPLPMGSSAKSLSLIGERAVEPLMRALKDEDELVRAPAAWALGGIGDTRAVEPLVQALKDEQFYVRVATAWALGEIGDTRAVEPLMQALEKDRDDFVRKATERALKKIKAKKN
jgi:HEAT repeat protein